MAVERPAGVQALSVIAICLGIMGILGGAFGILGLMINPKGQMPPGTDPKQAEVHEEFQRRLEKVTKETRTTSMIVIPIMMLTSAILAAAGIAGLQLKALGLVRVGFVSSLLVDAFGAVYNIVVQMKTMEVMKWYFSQLSGPKNLQTGMEMGMQVGMYTGLFFGIGWMVAKAAFYIVGIVYFSKPKVREAFEGGSAPAGF